MAGDVLTKYVWLLDILRRYGRLTRERVSEMWETSSVGDRKPLQRRTFLNYRKAIQEIFNVTIECDPKTYEYYIEHYNEHEQSVTDWLLNSTVTNNLLTSARDISDKIFLEEVPSAREYLAQIIEALRLSTAVKFDYQSYTRSRPTVGIMFEPYFVRIFRQRWYVVGRNVLEDKLKTYALDRMLRLEQTSQHFDIPADFSAATYFADAFGIVVDQSAPKRVILKVDATQAKYFRALPLHHSQTEMVTDKYSIFEYRMRVTRDLVKELLSHGSSVEALEPPELRAMLKTELEKALAPYAKR